MIKLRFHGTISFNSTNSYDFTEKQKIGNNKNWSKMCIRHAYWHFISTTKRKSYFLAEFRNSHFRKLLCSNTEAIWGPNFGLSFRLSFLSDTYFWYLFNFPGKKTGKRIATCKHIYWQLIFFHSFLWVKTQTIQKRNTCSNSTLEASKKVKNMFKVNKRPETSLTLFW